MSIQGMTHVMTLEPNHIYEFDYVNHEGVDSVRRVQFNRLQFGIVAGYYPTPTWLLNGYDLDRRQFRSFELTKVRAIRFDGKPHAFRETKI